MHIFRKVLKMTLNIKTVLRLGALHSVLEQICIKGTYLYQRVPPHESLYPIGLLSARIEILHIAQWLATVLGRHYLFPVPLGIYLICLHSLKSFVEFEFCAKKAISGSYGLENSQNFLKKAKNF